MAARIPRGAVFFWLLAAALLGLLLLYTLWWGYDPNGNVDISQRSAAASQVGDPTGHGRVISVQLQPVPEEPVSSLYRRGDSAIHGVSRPLRAIAKYIPGPLPAPLNQDRCGMG